MGINVLIFGSCVTRDPFSDLAEFCSGVDVNEYFARSSFASMNGNPVSGKDLSKIPSPFQRRMVESDFQKSFLNQSFESIDLIIFDFIDDRFSLLEMPCGACCTDSTEFKTAELQLNAKVISPFSEEFYQRWESGWELVLSKLKSAGVLNSVLINQVFLAHQDSNGVDFENQPYIVKMNKYLNRVYDRLENDLNKSQFIEYGATSFIGDCDHKWGRSPFHYSDSINRIFAQHINSKIVGLNCKHV